MVTLATERSTAPIGGRQCRKPGGSLLSDMPEKDSVFHEAPVVLVAPGFSFRSRCLSKPSRSWQRESRFRYLDLSLFSAGAGSKLVVARHDRASLQGSPGICDWPCGAAPIVPDDDRHRRDSADRDRRSGRYKRPSRILDLDKLSGGSRLLAGRPCLPKGGTRQRAPIMAGYGSIDRMVPLIVIGSVRLGPQPMASVEAFPFFASERQ